MSETASPGAAAGRGSAVIGLRVNEGRGDDYLERQETVNAAAAKCPGYLGTEVSPPEEELGEWTVIYRFDTVEHLNDWLTSTTRRELLERAAGVFERGTQQVAVNADDKKFATVVVSHPLKP